MAMVYTAVGIFASSLSSNQVIAFLIAILLCWFLYFGLDAIAPLFGAEGFLLVREMGLKSHYDSIARGILTLNDIIYFFSVTGFVLYMTVIRIQTKFR